MPIVEQPNHGGASEGPLYIPQRPGNWLQTVTPMGAILRIRRSPDYRQVSAVSGHLRDLDRADSVDHAKLYKGLLIEAKSSLQFSESSLFARAASGT